MLFRIIAPQHRDAGSCVVEDGFATIDDARQYRQKTLYDDGQCFEIEAYDEYVQTLATFPRWLKIALVVASDIAIFWILFSYW